MVAGKWNAPFGDLARIDQLEGYDAADVAAARLLTGLVSSSSAATVRNALPKAVPWVTFLPDEDADLFMAELFTIARSAGDLDDVARVTVLLAQWRHTAEVHADPILREILTAEPDIDRQSNS
jgi:hypothetical protein